MSIITVCISMVEIKIEIESRLNYSKTLNNEINKIKKIIIIKKNKYIERIHQMSYSSLSDNGILQVFTFLIK